MFNSFPSQATTSLYISLRLTSFLTSPAKSPLTLPYTEPTISLGLGSCMRLTQLPTGMNLAEKGFFQGLFSAGNTLTKASMNTILLHHIRVVMKPLSRLLSTSTTAEHQPSTKQERSLGGCSSPEGQQRFPKPMPRSTDEAAASSLQKTNTFWGPKSPSRYIHLRARTSSRLRMSSKNGGYLWGATLCL